MLEQKAIKIKIVIVDVDGILTDGRIYYSDSGDNYRVFNVHDGFGFVLLHKAGIESAIITSKCSKAVQNRAKELQINTIFTNVENKLEAFQQILEKFRFKPEQVCYAGDDLLDIPVLKQAGLSVTVPQACDEVKYAVDYITQKNAGKGAVREIIEFILKTQGKWDNLIKMYSY